MKQLAVCVSPLQCGKLYHVIKSYADRNVGFKTYHSSFNLYKACVYTFLLPNLTAFKMVGCGGKKRGYKTKNRLMVAIDSNKGPNLKVVKWCLKS